MTAASRASPSARPTFHALDGLRGIAAILVVVYHCEHVMGVALVPNGYLAVDLFFVISGVVVAHAYDGRLAEGLSVGRFAMMRAVRFWPLYALGLALGVVTQFAYHATGAPQAMEAARVGQAVLLNGAFVPALFPTYGNTLFPLNVVAWSLFFELVVNILYAGFRPVLTRRVTGWLVLASGAGFAVAASLHGTVNVGWSSTELWAGLLRTVFSFAAGVLICRWRGAMPRAPFGVLAGAVLLCLSVPLPEAVRPFATLGFVLLLSPLIVAAGTRAEVPGRWMPAVAALGAMSYALYAIHKPLLSLVNMGVAWSGVSGLAACVVFLVGLCGACLALDRWFDRPVRRWLGQRLVPSKVVQTV